MTATLERLERIWEDEPGLAGVFGTVDHKKIGRRYIITAFAFLLAGGVQALFMRAQLARPDETLLGPDVYNQLMTMHGTTMIFLFATPIIAGFGNYLVPLMIGSRDMAFPRLNALSYWIYLFSGLFLYSSFLVGAAPDGGWFNYVPLTGSAYAPDLNIDFWLLGIAFLGVSTTVGGINFIVTIFKLRAPGMSVNRMPLFVWSILVVAFMIVFALPALTLACILLELDRKLGMHFFDAEHGGSALLWQHLFWFFGHPEVYIVSIPGAGLISSIIPAFTRRRMVGYTWIATSMVAIGVISFGVWVHHMFTTGIPELSLDFFTAASLIIGIPSGVQVFSWVATIVEGRVLWRTPFLYSIGSIVIFVLGGVTGVMVAVAPFDAQVHDSYFVVAHFHYVLVGMLLFPALAALYHWMPKVTGRMMNERLGTIAFWFTFVGFHVTFFPQHILGLMGMPRRVYTFDKGLGWDVYNLISSVGAVALALGILITVADALFSVRHGEPAGDNPWGAGTLEWAIPSPPPHYNFAEIPAVRDREPLWAGEEDGAAPGPPLRDQSRETIATMGLDADPERVVPMPGETYTPFVVALGGGIACGGVLAEQPVVIGIGLAMTLGAALRWLRRIGEDPA